MVGNGSMACATAGRVAVVCVLDRTGSVIGVEIIDDNVGVLEGVEFAGMGKACKRQSKIGTYDDDGNGSYE